MNRNSADAFRLLLLALFPAVLVASLILVSGHKPPQAIPTRRSPWTAS